MAISPLPNMIGPQVSGPLGGASFLSVDEMTSGTDRANKIANQQLDTFAKGYNLGEGVQASQAAKQKKAELTAIKTAEFEAQNQFMQQQQQQAPQPTVAPTQSAGPVVQPEQPVSPAATPPVVAPVAPAGPAPTVGGWPSNMAAPTATPAASAQPEATPTVVQPAAQAPAPVAMSGAPVLPQEGLTAEVAPKSVLERMRSDVTLPNGSLNRFAQPVVESRKKLIAGLVEQGKVSPETAQEYNEAIDAARAKAEKEAVELQGKIAEVDGKKIDNRKKAIEVKAAFREAEDNAAFHVYQTLMAGDEPNIDGAKLAAGELGVDFDGSPKAMKDLQIRAQRSPDYKANLENAKAEKELAKGGKTETAGLPDGYFRVEGNPTVYVQGDDGRPRVATQSEIEAASVKRASAGATKISVGDGRSPITGEKIPEGAVPLPKMDAKQQLEERDSLQASEDVITGIETLKKIFPEVQKEAGIKPGEGGATRSLKTWAARKFDNAPKGEIFQQTLAALRNAALRLNKGPQTDKDAAREIEGLLDSGMTPEALMAQADVILNKAKKRRQSSIDAQRGYVSPEGNPKANPDKGKEQEASQADPMAKYKRK